MHCPKCEAPTIVLDTRQHKWRRRECKACGHKFYTVESVVDDLPTAKRKKRAAPKPAKAPKLKAARPAERKPLPPPAFHVKGSILDAEPERETPSAPFSYALTMPPGAAVRLNR